MNAIRPAPKARNVIAQAKRGTSAGLGLRPHTNHEPCKGGILSGARRFAGALIVLVLAGIAIQSAIAEIGYDSLPTEIKQRLETVIPVIYWQSASPQQALTDIIEKVNAIDQSFAPLKIAAPDAKPHLSWEPPPIRPGGTLADSAVIPDQTVTASVRQAAARELIDYVCERCGFELAISDFGGELCFVPPTRYDSLVTAKVEVPKNVRRECEQFASVSWLAGIGWKHALFLKCDASPDLRVQWRENDTLLQMEGYPVDVWKVRRVVREMTYREQSKQRPMTDDERKFLRLYDGLRTVRVKFPEGELPLDALIQHMRTEAEKQNVAFKIHIPPKFEKLLPAKAVSSKEINAVGAVPGLDPDPVPNPTPNLVEGLIQALRNYGLELAPRNDSEFTLVPRNLHHPPAYSDERTYTWEFKISWAELEELQKNDKHGDLSEEIPPPLTRGRIAIYSKSTGTLTVMNYWWNLMRLQYRIDSMEKDNASAKRKSLSPPLPRRK